MTFDTQRCSAPRHLVAHLVLTLLLAGLMQQAAALDYRSQQEWVPLSGEMQSPVAIDTSKVIEGRNRGEDARLAVHYQSVVTAKMVDTGHGLQLDFAPGSWSMLRGRRAELLQMHFHVPGEHTIDGKLYPAEGHFVHRAANGRLSVIGVLFEEGAPNPAVAAWLEAFARGGKGAQVKLDIGPMLAPLQNYYHYIGSLTAPPLAQNVEWYLLQKPLTISAAQIAAMRRVDEGNNRAVQPLNGRPVLHVTGR